MVHLLIVDDEIHAVEGIRSGVEWQKLGITSVFTAYNAKQAQEVFDRERVDIMLCDIEMPQATGLELAEWVRNNSPKTETIFLTCHADFKYAKQALQLGSLDYILKPIPFKELEKVILKAVEKIDKDSELIEFSQYGRFWFQHQPMLIERFWLDIITQTIPSNAEAVGRAAADRNIPYAAEMIFVPILISVQRWHKQLTLRDEKILEYALKNTAEEVLFGSRRDGQIISTGNGRLLAILSASSHTDFELTLRSLCEHYIDMCRQYFYCDLSCYIGDKVHGHGMFEMVNRLQLMEKNNVAYNNKVILSFELKQHPPANRLPDMELWGVMLKEGKGENVLEEAACYFERQMRIDALDANLLHQFYQNFQQMLYHMLQTKGIQAHQLFSDSISLELAANAIRTVTDTRSWMNHAVRKAMGYISAIEQSQSVIERVKHYIKLNIAKDLSREDIANYVFLNPDYLTRIFKKETGMAVSDYLFYERLKLAKELLAKTDMSIGAVASHIGYANFSHFSRMFKKYTNLNPNEYRQLHQ
ncbi:response regulator [Paenibacillus mucilaginosus]|uniref:YesN4 n=2 Tax=Paenibacillus mucilaginosus TaxID=61624 RepID=H6NA71_9BACL|nr:response regulator [Paenibacillus mucilaginosus]AFC28915.1 YesN4 [Paenibacillus mucilaginosus 3016]MCG7213357.1 response regulator [Paenibacillus mucilaginosus]WDM29492.1 response regulator [Paenibacillus mucilaginosus]WFA17669.1 response regulator [Paenibacillus mucilaginosus]